MRNDFKPAAFDPHSEGGKTAVFQLVATRWLVRLSFLSAIQAAERNSLCPVKNGTARCAQSPAFLIAMWPLAPVAQGQRSFSRTSFGKENQQ